MNDLTEMKKLMNRLESINEGKDSAALHTVNAKFANLLDRLNELLEMHKHRAAREGTAVNGIELSADLESFIETERYNRGSNESIGEDRYDDDKQFGAYTNTDKEGFSQFVVDFDGQVDDILQAGWQEAEDEYGTDGVLSPEFESALERMVSSYCKQCNII
jgi:hypothetical protein